MGEENLKLLGVWWLRKMKRVKEKREEALSDLAACGVDLEILQYEWECQVHDITKKAPSMFL